MLFAIFCMPFWDATHAGDLGFGDALASLRFSLFLCPDNGCIRALMDDGFAWIFGSNLMGPYRPGSPPALLGG